MSNISIIRPLQTTTASFVGDIGAGSVVEIGDANYVPLFFENFNPPDISITNITLTANATTISGTVGKFDNVRPGDIVSTTSVGAFDAKPAVAVNNVYTVSGKNFVIYPETYTSTNLGVQAGDAILGTGIPASTFVERIDHSTRQIFITNACTASGVQTDIEVQPPIRVTAVRTSSAGTNANQIDIDSTVSVGGTDATLTITPGASLAVFAVLRFVPIDNTINSIARLDIGVSYISGNSVVGSADGLHGLEFTTLPYSGAGSFQFDADTFLTAARLPRPANV